MTDCPRCGRPVDGIFCTTCEGRRRNPRTPPPMGFDGLFALCNGRRDGRNRDPEADAERAAIQGEGA